MATILDLSQPIRPGLPAFPIYIRPFILSWTSIDTHGFRSEIVHMVTHTSTHLDAPAHFIDRGETVDELSLERFMVDAVALDLSFRSSGGALTSEDLAKALKGLEVRVGDAILIYTGWSEKFGSQSYLEGYPWLGVDAVEMLISLGISLVGVDTPSVDSLESRDFPAHRNLLGRGILIIENLGNLRPVLNRRFKLACFPLKIANASASPVRAVAILE